MGKKKNNNNNFKKVNQNLPKKKKRKYETFILFALNSQTIFGVPSHSCLLTFLYHLLHPKPFCAAQTPSSWFSILASFTNRPRVFLSTSKPKAIRDSVNRTHISKQERVLVREQAPLWVGLKSQNTQRAADIYIHNTSLPKPPALLLHLSCHSLFALVQMCVTLLAPQKKKNNNNSRTPPGCVAISQFAFLPQ